MVGDAFTAADLNVASVLSLASLAGIDLRPFPDEEGWLGRCRARPAFRRVAR